MNKEVKVASKVEEPKIKKKGRPRKNPIVEVDINIVPDIEKKKRGRKKKEKVEEIKQKKKRGRKAQVKYYSSSIRKKIPLTTVIQDNDKSILHLDIKDDKLDVNNIYDTVKDEYLDSNLNLIINSSQISELKRFNKHSEIDELEEFIEKNNLESISDLYERKIKSRLNEDNLLIEELENIHKDISDKNFNIDKDKNNDKNKDKEQILSKNIENRKKGFFTILEKFYENTKWLDSTDVCCWWCCHTFSTIPIGMPTNYKNNKFHVKGIFCGFSCMIAYKNTLQINKKNDSTNMLINFLFKKLTGIMLISSIDNYKSFLKKSLKLDMFGSGENSSILKDKYIESLLLLCCEPLQPAPPKETLKIFGGELTINDFRKSTKEHKIFKLIEYPMFIERNYIEEIDIQNVKNINVNVFKNMLGINDTSVNSNKNFNILNNKKVDDAKSRVELKINKNKNVIANNSIDKFLKYYD